MGHWSPDAIAVTLVGVLYLANALGLLERFGVKRPSSSDAAAEIDIAQRTIDRLRIERNQALEVARKLEQTRSLEPVLDQLHQNAELQSLVLDRLVHHNGSFKHMENAMGDIRQSLQLLTGFIAELHDLPVKPPPRPRRTKT